MCLGSPIDHAEFFGHLTQINIFIAFMWYKLEEKLSAGSNMYNNSKETDCTQTA